MKKWRSSDEKVEDLQMKNQKIFRWKSRSRRSWDENGSKNRSRLLDLKRLLVLGRENVDGQSKSVSGESTFPVLVPGGAAAERHVDYEEEDGDGRTDSDAGVEGGVVGVNASLIVVGVVVVLGTVDGWVVDGEETGLLIAHDQVDILGREVAEDLNTLRVDFNFSKPNQVGERSLGNVNYL
jgi:hypothetical protein